MTTSRRCIQNQRGESIKINFMGLIREPLNVDFYFQDRQMTDADLKKVSDFIAKEKEKKTGAQEFIVSKGNISS